MRFRSSRTGLLVGLTVLLLAGPAFAQERGSTALVTGYPGTIGMLWHASDNLALRPELLITTSTGTSETGIDDVVNESDAWALGVGLSALFYMAEADKVRPYLSPRFTYTRQSADTGYTSDSLPGSTTRTNDFNVSFSFGSQYMPVERFGVFGEAGLGFARRSSERVTNGAPGPSSFTTKATTISIGTRYAIGVVFYF